MPKSTRRGRVNEEFLREISDIVKNEIKDPRVTSPIVSVLRVEVTSDLAFAKVYITVYGDEKARQRAFDGLVQARSFIRKRLSERMTTRRVPALIFVADDSIAHSIYMSSVIDSVIQGKDTHEE